MTQAYRDTRFVSCPNRLAGSCVNWLLLKSLRIVRLESLNAGGLQVIQILQLGEHTSWQSCQLIAMEISVVKYSISENSNITKSEDLLIQKTRQQSVI